MNERDVDRAEAARCAAATSIICSATLSIPAG